MKIIVTGGSGFLGNHMIDALKENGHSIKNIDLIQSSKPNDENLETIVADIRDKDKMVDLIKDADVVFHFAGLIEAGESVKNPQKFIDYNISGTLSVLEAMRINNIKTIIFSSSAAIYGEPKNIPIKEDDPAMPINPYGMTKLAMEGLISSYVESHGFTGIALRYFNLYGPGENHQPETHAIPNFIKQVYQGENIKIFGNGQHQRDYIHIRDIVDAHLKALDFAINNPNNYHYINLSTEKPSTTQEIAETIAAAMEKQASITNLPDRPGDPMVLYASAQKAKDLLNWQARVSLDDGIKETVSYFVRLWESKSD